MTMRSSGWTRLARRAASATPVPAPAAGTPQAATDLSIAPNDPLLAYFQTAGGAVDLETLELDSAALTALRGEGTRLVIPLISQGELIGLLKLGPRRSEQDYSHDDRKLLDDLAAHAAPAVRVAQLVRQQQAEVRERERIAQELRVAQLIQQQFLPHELPHLAGWHVAAFYRPAREVGGDFYDFVNLPGGQVGIVIGDVTDKGVPAALVMATTHSILRAEAPRLLAPSDLLEQVNDLLVADMPAHMFVTCLYAVLDPASGLLRFANAGHNLPYVRGDGGVTELRAIGMPLGLLPGMRYEEREVVLAPGDALLLHSDGLAEAHGPGREMFGFPRPAKLVGERPGGEELIDHLLGELARFTGPDWEQEDDITLVTLQRSGGAGSAALLGAAAAEPGDARVLAEFAVASEPGNERLAIERVAAAAAGLNLPGPRLERLKTAVAEATMNAIEHGNGSRPEVPVEVRVLASPTELRVHVTDQGGATGLPEPAQPDLDAKLAGVQDPRGWGLFLIRNMVDDLRTASDGPRHTVELVLRLASADQQEVPDGPS